MPAPCSSTIRPRSSMPSAGWRAGLEGGNRAVRGCTTFIIAARAFMLRALGRTVTLLQLEKAKREYISHDPCDGEWHFPCR